MAVRRNSSKAFTLLEVAVVISLLGLVFGFSVLYTRMSQLRSDVMTQAAELVAYLRLAQSDASTGKEDGAHGIHLESTAYVLFSEAVYNATDTDNRTIDLPASVEIQNIALNGGGNEVLFTAPYGETATEGTFEITSTETNFTISISISPLGNVDYY